MARRNDEQLRLQRMLAREQGLAPPAAPHSAARPAPERQPPHRTAREAPAARRTGNARPLSPILRRRRRRRRLAVLAVVLAVALAVAAASGALGQAALALGDLADSAVLYFNRAGGGWPAQTGIQTPLRAEALGGGCVLMDGEDVVVYSAYGKRVRAVQPGYARPCLAMGDTRFAVYNRTGTELRIESRTRTVATRSTENGILLCALSPNGSLALLTQDERYAAVLEVLDPGLEDVITYSLAQDDGVPVALCFAPDNRRLASGAITAQGGRMQSLVYLMDTAEAELGPCYRADAGSLVLELHWLGQDRVLAVFDTYAALLDADAQELARYSYGGAVLQNAAVTGRQAALLLAGRGGGTLVILDEKLNALHTLPAAGTRVCATATALYLLESDAVACYGYDGALRSRQELTVRPQAVLDAAQTLLVGGGMLQPLEDAGA